MNRKRQWTEGYKDDSHQSSESQSENEDSDDKSGDGEDSNSDETEEDEVEQLLKGVKMSKQEAPQWEKGIQF
jgi:hypothetical protein